MSTTGAATAAGTAVEDVFVVNIVEQVLYPIQVRATSPEEAEQKAEEIYYDNEFTPTAEEAKVESKHVIFSDHIGTEVVARNGKAVSEESSLLDKLIELQRHPIYRERLERLVQENFGELKF
jgi:hypothetical protein